MKVAAVTGATGFMGNAVVRRLLEDGMKVYAIDLLEEKLCALQQYGTVIPVVASFQDYLTLHDRISEKIDIFYHFAWAGGFERATLKNDTLQLRNAIASCDAIRAAVSLQAAKFIYAGTVNEIETQQFLEHFETFTARPTCIYAAAKTAAELICRTIAQEYSLQYCSGLIPMPYGEGNRSPQLINIVLNQLLHGHEPKLIEGNNLYDLVYIEDIAKAFVTIGQKGLDGKRYYIGHRELKTFRWWMEAVRGIVAPSVPLRFGEYEDSLNLDYSQIDLDALYNDTGFECQADFRESMLKTAEWIKTLGW